MLLVGKNGVKCPQMPYQYRETLALYLLQQLPALFRIPVSSVFDEDGTIRSSLKIRAPFATRNKDSNLDIMPKSLMLYSLYYDRDAGIWEPYVVARLDERKRKEINVAGRRKTVLYRIKSVKSPKEGETHLYGHISGDRTEFSTEILARLKQIESRQEKSEDLWKSLADQLTGLSRLFLDDLGNSAYLGIRFGRSLMKEDEGGKSTYYGLLSEFRSGFVDGLRVYVDVWPEYSPTSKLVDTNFGGNRTTFGWSFTYEIDSLDTRFDLTPKVGVWNFRANALIFTVDGANEEVFEVDYAPSLDLEVGVETVGSSFLMRGWGSTIVTGYNGNLLTLSTGEVFFSGQQAIAFTNSDSKLVIKPDIGINAILEAEGNSSDIAFFKPIWKVKIPPVGTKVLLEKR